MNMDKIVPVRHDKTGKRYFALRNVLNCTNKDDGTVMVLYCNMDGEVFVRERDEFWQKFTVSGYEV